MMPGFTKARETASFAAAATRVMMSSLKDGSSPSRAFRPSMYPTELVQNRIGSLADSSARWLRPLALIVVATLLGPIAAAAAPYQIGVYYFPGWKDHQEGATFDLPWDRIKPYPDREPLLGWYAEGDDKVMQQQIDWMADYGIKYVVFDWYFGASRSVFLEHALNAFRRAPNRTRLQYAILWANHDRMPSSLEDWNAMIRYWAQNYFRDENFLRIDGKPTVFVFSADLLKNQAESFGQTTKTLLDRAQAIAQAEGLAGVYFIAGTGADEPMISSYAKASGYDAFSAYNYHSGPDGNDRLSHSFDELDQDYRDQWNRFAARGNLPLIVPLTSGWDRRPWGASGDPAHDLSRSTPASFQNHLLAARTFIDAHRDLTRGMAVICCWNEYGEGSFIEPTKSERFVFLEQIRSVFGATEK